MFKPPVPAPSPAPPRPPPNPSPPGLPNTAICRREEKNGRRSLRCNNFHTNLCTTLSIRYAHIPRMQVLSIHSTRSHSVALRLLHPMQCRWTEAKQLVVCSHSHPVPLPENMTFVCRDRTCYRTRILTVAVESEHGFCSTELS